MRLAGEGERHHGAAVEGIFEGDDGGTLAVRARDLHCILDGFGAAVHEKCFLGEFSWSDFVQALGEPDVAFVGRHLHTGVHEAIELLANGADDGFTAMTDVEAPNAAGEVDVAVAVDIFEPCPLGFRDVNGRAMRQAAGHGLSPARRERFGLGAGDWSA